MSWPFDTSDPFITPEQVVLARDRLGVTAEEWALPPTLVAAFQRAAYQRLLERTGADARQPNAFSTGAVDGVPVAVVRIGIGAPVAALVLEEAIARGVRTVLVAGAAGSLQPHLPTGSTVVVTGAEREDGTSHHYLPAGEVVAADPEITGLLEEHARARGAEPVRGRSWTIDAPYRETVGAISRHRKAGVAVVEMEAAAIFAVVRVRRVRAGLIVAVSDELFGPEWKADFRHPRYVEALLRVADVAVDVTASLRETGVHS